MMNGVTTGAIADRRRSFIGSAQTLMRTLPSFPSTRRTRSLAVNDQRKEVADESSASSAETTFQENMALKMNWFHGGLGTSSLVWPGMLMMCLAVIGGFSYVAALSSDETTSSEDGPIVVIPFAEGRASEVAESHTIGSPTKKAQTIIRCNSAQGITPSCYVLIKQHLRDKNVGRWRIKKPIKQADGKLIVELQDDAQLKSLRSNLVMDLNVHAFYLNCMMKSPVDEKVHKCRGGIPRPYNPDRHAKYHKQRTVGSTEFLSNDSGVLSAICYREFRWDFPEDVKITYTEAKGEKNLTAPFKKNSLWNNESGLYLIDGTHGKLDSDVLEAAQRDRTAREVESVSISREKTMATLPIEGYPSKFELVYAKEGLTATRIFSDVLGPFDAGDIAVTPTIYVVHLLEKSRRYNRKSRIDTESGNVFKIDCKAGDERPSLEKCARKIRYNKSRHRKADIDIYVVSSSFFRMSQFTRALDTVHGAVRGGRLWANYFFEKDPLEREHLARRAGRRAGRIFRSSMTLGRNNMDNFQLATLTSFKAFSGGLPKINNSFCARFIVKYEWSSWELWVDNIYSDKYFQLDQESGTVRLIWGLGSIFVSRSNDSLKKLSNKFPHPPDSRQFELRKKSGESSRNSELREKSMKVNIFCDERDIVERGDKVQWDRVVTAIATNRSLSDFHIKPDFSRTWTQLTSQQ